ncbi:MAG TPA: dUTP diphosphatase [Acidobacteriota bacterium]|nr:dUTP diphosphatase [Acidobacteriota bacterium]
MSRPEVRVLVRRLAGTDDLPLPSYQTDDSAAVDLHAALTSPLELQPGAIELVPTGLTIALPSGYEAQVRPRSGLAVKHGVSLPNTPATIDADYRGEIKVPLINHGATTVTLKRGMRIAQMLVAPVPRIVWEEVGELPETDRGPGGFGHTGE